MTNICCCCRRGSAISKFHETPDIYIPELFRFVDDWGSCKIEKKVFPKRAIKMGLDTLQTTTTERVSGINNRTRLATSFKPFRKKFQNITTHKHYKRRRGRCTNLGRDCQLLWNRKKFKNTRTHTWPTTESGTHPGRIWQLLSKPVRKDDESGTNPGRIW